MDCKGLTRTSGSQRHEATSLLVFRAEAAPKNENNHFSLGFKLGAVFGYNHSGIGFRAEASCLKGS